MPADVKTTNPKKTINDCIASRSINMMMTITENLTYNQLYAAPFHYKPGNQNNPGPNPKPIPDEDPNLSALDRMIRNISLMPDNLLKGASTNAIIVRDRLIGNNGALMQIKFGLVAQGYPDLALGTLFHTMLADIAEPARSGFKLIIDELEILHRFAAGHPEKDQMYHFCAPFLTIQKDRIPNNLARPKRKPTKSEFENEFLRVLGSSKMENLYVDDTHGDQYKARRDAAKDAIDRCILKEYRPASTKPPEVLAPVPGTYGNSRFCTGSDAGCAGCNHEDDWCNDFEYEPEKFRCSLGSDYH